MQPYELFHAEISPFSQRVMMLLNHKDLPYRTLSPPDGPGSDAYRALTPLGKVPALRFNGRILPESWVICEFLEERHPEPAMLPADPSARAHLRMIARVADLYVMPPMTPLFANLSRRNRDEAAVAKTLAELDKGLAGLETLMTAGETPPSGSPTLTDLALAPVLMFVETFLPVFDRAAPLRPYPSLAAFYRDCRRHKVIDEGLGRIEAGLVALRSPAQKA